MTDRKSHVLSIDTKIDDHGRRGRGLWLKVNSTADR